jgi:hypothetical protein
MLNLTLGKVSQTIDESNALHAQFCALANAVRLVKPVEIAPLVQHESLQNAIISGTYSTKNHPLPATKVSELIATAKAMNVLAEVEKTFSEAKKAYEVAKDEQSKALSANPVFAAFHPASPATSDEEPKARGRKAEINPVIAALLAAQQEAAKK